MVIKKDEKEFRYKDIDLSLSLNPLRGDVLPVYDVEAIKRSVKNLILVSIFERRLNPWAGSMVYTQLFENFTPQTAALIKKFITNTLNTYEPRVKTEFVNVKQSEDEHFLEVNVFFTIVNIPGTFNVDLKLVRLR